MVVATILAMRGGQTGSAGRRTNQQGQGGIGKYDRRDSAQARARQARLRNRNQNERRARNT